MESRVGATNLFNILDYSFIRDRAEKNREKNDAAPFLVSPRVARCSRKERNITKEHASVSIPTLRVLLIAASESLLR